MPVLSRHGRRGATGSEDIRRAHPDEARAPRLTVRESLPRPHELAILLSLDNQPLPTVPAARTVVDRPALILEQTKKVRHRKLAARKLLPLAVGPLALLATFGVGYSLFPRKPYKPPESAGTGSGARNLSHANQKPESPLAGNLLCGHALHNQGRRRQRRERAEPRRHGQRPARADRELDRVLRACECCHRLKSGPSTRLAPRLAGRRTPSCDDARWPPRPDRNRVGSEGKSGADRCP